MHKRFVNHCTLDLTLSPCGPILIKSGKEGADPTKPDMEFVETYHKGGRSIYLPGSSLKGALRAHAERIVRTVGSDQPSSTQIWASDPLDRSTFRELEKEKDSCKVYCLSSFTDQMFGSTAIASRVRIEDAYPSDLTKLKIEERNGVAIDRVFGSVAVGPFNYQVCTAGEFRTKIHFKNFTLAQLGLMGLVLRDLNDGWFGLGFAKSRGMGLVETKLNSAIVQYPGCVIDGDAIKAIGNNKEWAKTALLGTGEFLNDDEAGDYGFPGSDQQETPVAGAEMPLGFGVQLTWTGADEVNSLFEQAVMSWRQVLKVKA